MTPNHQLQMYHLILKFPMNHYFRMFHSNLIYRYFQMFHLNLMTLKIHYFLKNLRFHYFLKNLIYLTILMFLKIHYFLKFPMNLKNLRFH
jgi:hypothetical protein